MLFFYSSGRPGISPKTIIDFGKLYRAFQLHHTYLSACTDILKPPVAVFGILLTVSLLYILINLHHVTPMLGQFWICISLFGVMVCSKVFSKAVSTLTKRSRTFRNSIYECRKLTKINRAFYKSCQPLEIKIGSVLKFQRNTLVIMVQAVVIKVIDLIIMFPVKA